VPEIAIVVLIVAPLASALLRVTDVVPVPPTAAPVVRLPLVWQNCPDASHVPPVVLMKVNDPLPPLVPPERFLYTVKPPSIKLRSEMLFDRVIVTVPVVELAARCITLYHLSQHIRVKLYIGNRAAS